MGIFNQSVWKILSTRIPGAPCMLGLDDWAGYSYDAEDGLGRSPLHEAVELGHREVVESWQ